MFNKNLELIDNVALKRRLSKILPEESKRGISYCVTPSNDYVLLKDELPADDLNNPREAIKKSLKDTIKREMNSNDIIITFGIGLCYLLDEVFNTYPSRIYVYEPDLNLLHFVLNNVDISEHLSSGRIFITNDLDELINKLSSNFLTKDKVEIVYLPNYAMVKNKELLMLTQKDFDACKSKMVDVNTIVRFSKAWLYNTIGNLAYINTKDTYLLSDLEGKYSGRTALIAGAGPSLEDNIANIKANREKFVVFAVNKNVQYLLKNDIKPDFVVCLDAMNMDRTLGSLENNFAEMNAIVDLRTDNAIMKKGFAKIFFNFSETDFLMKKLSEKNNFIKFNETGGSAATFALTAAIKMGFSKIVLAGIDLAFKDNIIYAYGETMQRVSQEQIIVDNTRKNLVQVKSVTGGMVYTREDYQAFIHHFAHIIKEANYTEVYNISSFGAYIEGAKNVKFEDLYLNPEVLMPPVSFVQPFKLQMKEFIDEEFCNINNIISILSKGVFSPALISAIVKSTMLYQYLQPEILVVLQKNFAPELAEDFIEKTKTAIKIVVEQLQKNRLV